mmetsp:Transcript_6543/g.16036  ORF Transcript_6543/g.16036 Transcript_6543/m.16036 type:complete len:155 (+) Transcript_6543:70-534(+)
MYSSLAAVARRSVVPTVGRAPLAVGLRGHCQVPCGIFHDDQRVDMMKEDAETIRKAMVQSSELHKANGYQDMHQVMRWINTKEEHAQSIMTTIGDYFLAQKVKKDALSEGEYKDVLVKHHAVMVAAMKTKQTGDIAAADALDAAIAELAPIYGK